MSTASDMVAFYLDAEKQILKGKSVEYQGRKLGLENLAEIRAGRKEWERRLRNETTKSNYSLASFN